jgi:hypothetical protein
MDFFPARKTLSQATKEKIAKSKRGSIPWNKGKPMAEGVKEKISRSMMGRKAWNKGKQWGDAIKKKISKGMKHYHELISD